jgi:uncharacterized protein YoxC
MLSMNCIMTCFVHLDSLSTQELERTINQLMLDLQRKEAALPIEKTAFYDVGAAFEQRQQSMCKKYL